MAKNFLPQNLRYLRTKIGINQDELGEIIGKKRSIIGTYESGKSQPNIDTLLKLADFFKVSLNELITIDLTNIGYGAPRKTYENPPENKVYTETSEPEENSLSAEQDEDYLGNPFKKVKYLQQLIAAKDEVINSKESENQILKRLIKELDEKITVLRGGMLKKNDL